jgi:hypothetical protein
MYVLHRYVYTQLCEEIRAVIPSSHFQQLGSTSYVCGRFGCGVVCLLGIS